MSNLILSMSQHTAANPYRFRMTNINVYSFEEAAFHCFQYWKESADEFTSDDFADWVAAELGLSYIASKIREISSLPQFSDRLTGFLSLTDMYGAEDFDSLRSDLSAWERRQEWERLKERGDYLMNHDEPEKACFYYRKSLQFESNPVILNNLGVALMKTGQYKEAVACFDAAVSFNTKASRKEFLLNQAEALIFSEDLKRAGETLDTVESEYGTSADVLYFRGEIELHDGNTLSSLPYFEKSLEQDNNPHTIYRMAEVYLKMRLYDKAIATLNRIVKKDRTYHKKLAEAHIAANNAPAAIKCMEKALFAEPQNIDLWTRLAMYHRLDYDLARAFAAITRAKGLSPDNRKVNLEYAKIRKAQGRIRDYQTVLHDILTSFKEDYRESASI